MITNYFVSVLDQEPVTGAARQEIVQSQLSKGKYILGAFVTLFEDIYFIQKSSFFRCFFLIKHKWEVCLNEFL
jgi:hypothetical protein